MVSWIICILENYLRSCFYPFTASKSIDGTKVQVFEKVTGDQIDSEDLSSFPKLVSYASSQYRHEDAREADPQQPANNASASMSHAQSVENSALAISSGNGRMVLRTRPRAMKCKICGKNFLKKAYLDRHITSIHSTILKKFVCPVCSRPFESRFNLKTHGTTQHGVVFSNEDMEEIEVVNDEE